MKGVARRDAMIAAAISIATTIETASSRSSPDEQKPRY